MVTVEQLYNEIRGEGRSITIERETNPFVIFLIWISEGHF